MAACENRSRTHNPALVDLLENGEISSDTYYRLLLETDPAKQRQGESRLLAAILTYRPGNTLGPMETRVLRCAAEGLSAKETAETLRIAAETVKSHRRAILRKLAARNITHAVAIAIARVR